MLYKENWNSTENKLKAYWHQENEGRCLLNVTAFRNKKLESPRIFSKDRDGSIENYWLDTEKIINRHIEYFENISFEVESIPYLNVTLGPGSIASYLGAPIHFSERTAWFDRIIQDWDKVRIQFDENNEWWKKTKEITAQAVVEGKGKFLVGVADLGGAADILAHLRGSEELCFDLLDDPDEIKKDRDMVMKIWFYCIDELYKITQDCQEGSIDWMGLWAPDLHHSLQCDFSALISPITFEEFFIPEIRELCRRLPYSLYHLDGPDAVRHLDLLLDIKELNAIQWVPGAGQSRAVKWIPLLKKIQMCGKSLWIAALPEDVEDLLKELSPKGLYINIENTFENIEEAMNFIKFVDKLCSTR